MIAFIDDATGRVLGARFFEQETTQGYLAVLHALVQRLGAPLALYSDRHSIFTKAEPEDAKPTQFERALLQLHIEPICAHSPQAKGRVERLFQTLQDRMCKTMRLQGIDNIEQANTWLDEYLHEHDRRFAVAPQHEQDMHRPWGGGAQALADICSLHHQRQLSAQGACKFEGSILQLLPQQPHAPKARAMVDIAQHGDGALHLSYRGQPLAHRRYAMHETKHASHVEDHKTVNTRADKARNAQQSKLQRLRAELAFQDSQRTQGVFRPDTPPIVPALGLAATGYALRSQPQRPADHPAPSSSTGDISTLAKQGHFYFGLTDAADWQQRMDTSLTRCVHGYLDATRSKHLKSSVVAPGRTSCICRDWMSVYRAGRFSEVRLRLAVTRRRLL